MSRGSSLSKVNRGRPSGRLLAYVHSGCGTKRAIACTALAGRCRTPSARVLHEPFGPVRPPRSRMRLRARQPVVRIIRQEVVGPIVALLLLRRGFDPRELSPNAQHDTRVAPPKPDPALC